MHTWIKISLPLNVRLLINSLLHCIYANVRIICWLLQIQFPMHWNSNFNVTLIYWHGAIKSLYNDILYVLHRYDLSETDYSHKHFHVCRKSSEKIPASHSEPIQKQFRQLTMAFKNYFQKKIVIIFSCIKPVIFHRMCSKVDTESEKLIYDLVWSNW